MKKINFLTSVLVMLLAISVSSCIMKNGSNATPSMSLSSVYRFAPDTIVYDSYTRDSIHIAPVHISSTDKGFVLDTLLVGDTLFYNVALSSYVNNLDSFIVSYDPAKLHMYYDSLTYKTLLPVLRDSTPESVNLHFQKNWNGVSFRIYTVTKALGKHDVKLKVYSDAVFEKEPGMNSMGFEYSVLVDTIRNKK